MDEDVKIVTNLVNACVRKPSQMRSYLKEQGKDFSVNQIRSMKRKVVHTEHAFTYHQLKEMVEPMLGIPQEVDKPYVVDFSIDEEDEMIRVFVTSKLLLGNVKHFDHLQLDCTYRLNWNGLPLMLIGEYF